MSHYHEDHFRSDPVYAGRIVLAKDPRRMVSGEQAGGEALWKALDGQAKVERADGAHQADLDFASRLRCRTASTAPLGSSSR